MPSYLNYINAAEAKKIILNTVGVGSLTQLGLTLLLALLNHAGQIYTGPSQALVVLICTTAAASLTGYVSTKTYLKTGEPLEKAAKK
jgi:hypothetical protein